MFRTDYLLSIFELFLFTIALATKALFRGIAAACKSEAIAQTFAGASLVMMTIYTGQCPPIKYSPAPTPQLRLYHPQTLHDRSFALDNIHQCEFGLY